MDDINPHRLGDFHFDGVGYPTTHGQFIAQAFIWPAQGVDGPARNFMNLGIFDTKQLATQVATNYARHWIETEMRKRKS